MLILLLLLSLPLLPSSAADVLEGLILSVQQQVAPASNMPLTPSSASTMSVELPPGFLLTVDNITMPDGAAAWYAAYNAAASCASAGGAICMLNATQAAIDAAVLGVVSNTFNTVSGILYIVSSALLLEATTIGVGVSVGSKAAGQAQFLLAGKALGAVRSCRFIIP